MAWCKLWDDLIKDEDLHSLGLEYVGAFVHLLILANKCRRQGQFIQPDLTDAIGDRILTKDEIIKATHIKYVHFDELQKKFIQIQNKIFSIKNWDKYQGDAERIHRVRSKVRK